MSQRPKRRQKGLTEDLQRDEQQRQDDGPRRRVGQGEVSSPPLQKGAEGGAAGGEDDDAPRSHGSCFLTSDHVQEPPTGGPQFSAFSVALWER